MAAKVWLQQRWEMLLPLLEGLTLSQEEEIARICREEIEAWRARPGKASSLRVPMTDTRNEIKKLPLTASNTWMNPRTGKPEHIALKYLNFSPEEWAAMNVPSEEKFQQRLSDRKLIDHPDAVVEKAQELLHSSLWYEIAAGLSTCTGRRLAEILLVGEFHPKTKYTIVFGGQLKRRDEKLPPYEIPTLVEASLVLSALTRLRGLVDCANVDADDIGSKYGPPVTDAAQRAYDSLVPGRSGGDLYTHLFRSVYGRIATFYYAKPEISDLKYMSVIYGHYWLFKDGQLQPNYLSTLHYSDYLIGDGHGNIDGRQGIKLGEPGVELLEVFKPKPKPETETRSRRRGKKVITQEQETKKSSQTGYSILKPRDVTKDRIDVISEETGVKPGDETLSLMADEHYVLAQMVALVSPHYEQLGTREPVGALEMLLGSGGNVQVDQQLQDLWKTTLQDVISLLQDASVESESPVTYLRDLLASKRDFKKSYEKRHVGKDYSKMTLSKLRNTKTTEAAIERFRRAVQAIMDYNDKVPVPEMRWFINAAVVTELVGGRPSDAKEYLATRQAELDAHHQKFEQKVTPGYNRRSMKITERVKVKDEPEPSHVDDEQEEEVEQVETSEAVASE